MLGGCSDLQFGTIFFPSFSSCHVTWLRANAAESPLMRVAYFINQYPAVSHTFIRREIRAMEELGVSVVRFALRSGANLVDHDDRAEANKTRFILKAGV